MKLTHSGRIKHTLRLTGKDILELLPHLGTNYCPPHNAKADVTFSVPSGGDYSGDEVDFLTEDRVIIEWHTTKDDDDG